MTSTGNVFPGIGENNAGIGATAWTSPGNIVSDNATDASCNAAASSQYLVARNFAFAGVPVNATIVGITVRIEASESSTGSETLNARLQDETGTLVGNTKTASINGTGKTVYTYGGIADVWGISPTGNQIHDADWGVRFWFTTSHNVAVDYVTMAVEYTVPAVGVATETDTGLAVSRIKVKAVGVASETDAGLALGAVKRTVPGVGGETDTATGPAVTKRLGPGVAAELDAASAPAIRKIAGVGPASELDTALALDRAAGQTVPTGTATETDTALAPSILKKRSVATATELDSAVAVGRVKVAAHGSAVETDAALAAALAKQRGVGVALETDAAQALGHVKIRGVGTAAETDAALALSDVKRFAPGIAGETDAALSRYVTGQQVATGLATEVDAARSVAVSKSLTAGVSAAQATALPLAALKLRAVGLSEETDIGAGPIWDIPTPPARRTTAVRGVRACTQSHRRVRRVSATRRARVATAPVRSRYSMAMSLDDIIMNIDRFEQSALEFLDYDHNVEPVLEAGEIITGSQWTAPAGILIGVNEHAPSFTATTVKVWVGGGTVGQSYSLSNAVTTSLGRVHEHVLEITII